MTQVEKDAPDGRPAEPTESDVRLMTPRLRKSRQSISFRMSAYSGPPVMPVEGVGRVALVVVACVLVFAALFAVRTLIAPLLLGACVASMVKPWMTRLRSRFGGPKRAAAAATAGVVLVLALPIVAVVIPVVSETKELVALFRAGQLGAVPRFLFSLAPTQPRSFGEFVHAIGPRIAEAVPGLLGAAAEIVLGVFVFLMTLYYVLVDGDSAMRLARRVSPLAGAHLDALAKEFLEVGRGVLLSVGITALVEGGAAGIAYFAIGLPSAALLTLLTAVAALVPIGTVLIWGPVAAVLFSQGRTVAGSVVVFTGLVVISGIDHFVRPQLTRLARTRLHPLLVFLGMFGGMATLGGWGLFAGPLLLALGLAALRLYDRDQQARNARLAGVEVPGPIVVTTSDPSLTRVPPTPIGDAESNSEPIP
ncbi:MAG: AI-2E family transporter [Polyangiales bacterium]